MKEKNKILSVQDMQVSLKRIENADFISLTDIARYKDAERSDYILQNWLRTRSTIDFLGLWEQINNPGFNSIEFDGIKNQAGTNSFVLTPKRWIQSTNAIGIVSKTERYSVRKIERDLCTSVF